jgi:hypothetical protein
MGKLRLERQGALPRNIRVTAAIEQFQGEDINIDTNNNEEIDEYDSSEHEI